ncbi:hypothetical protein SCH01S_01_00920 [Sphingomonas changbaiensis NBRC 104936]|uniref:DUF559 domain-containing protein n=1 Tax=Sphingomonas changbaiensis NBRC 104936 TaxID=1219043 RepID=A0A0E9MK74_9SPHN|nr:DUF559 domain-containing protein [Sphingomonas changbaiensis]GAO37929.1 hypothetical protein SCH01S_01_00920 [Sphingomonas changbaiensis NBRC 104936]
MQHAPDPSPSPLAGEGGARREAVGGRGDAELLARAKWMRAHPTEAEKRLWSMLRVKRLAAFKFKRQVILRPYIVDFICFERRLIIEADGSQHADNKYDERRDAFLQGQGFEILRFWNNQVLGESLEVAEAIYARLISPSPSHACGVGPSLSRKGRGAANGASERA